MNSLLLARCCRLVVSRLVLLSLALGLFAAARVAATAAPQRDEVVYQLFVRSFCDSNGDRIGDLNGIRSKLDYLDDLGVTSLILTPLQPSPFYHHYFAANFEGVDHGATPAPEKQTLASDRNVWVDLIAGNQPASGNQIALGAYAVRLLAIHSNDTDLRTTPSGGEAAATR